MVRRWLVIQKSTTGSIDTDVKRLVAKIETTIQVNGRSLLFNLIKLGIRLGIVQEMMEDFRCDERKIPNKKFLERYMTTLLKTGMAEIVGEEKYIRPFELSFSCKDIENSIPDYISIYDYISSMAPYWAISEGHPNVLMSFGKDADVWDGFLSSQFCETYREVASHILNLKDGDKVLDVGCGSISPLYFSPLVSPNGRYVGIENSKNLTTLALNRIKRERYDWADVKNASVEDLVISSKYDAVICTDVLSYLSSPARALRTMYTALRPGGHLLIFDYFPDIFSFHHHAYEFYNSLNPSFRGFIRYKKVKETLENCKSNIEFTRIGKCFVKIQKRK